MGVVPQEPNGPGAAPTSLSLNILTGTISAALAAVLLAATQYLIVGYKVDHDRAAAPIYAADNGLRADTGRLERLKALTEGSYTIETERLAEHIRRLDVSAPALDPAMSRESIEWANVAITNLARDKGSVAGMLFVDRNLAQLRDATVGRYANQIAAIEEFRELHMHWSDSDARQRDAYLREVQVRLTEMMAFSHTTLAALDEEKQRNASALSRLERLKQDYHAKFDLIQLKVIVSALGALGSIGILFWFALGYVSRKLDKRRAFGARPEGGP